MDPFVDDCENSDIESIKKMSLEGCDLDRGFRWACYDGHYMLVRYLVELHIHDSTYKPINIHSDNELGFRWACENGHYNVVRYLVELYKNNRFATANHYKQINIHSEDEDGFIWACENGHYKIAN